ncbi:restriction endonuclease subunit S [Bradyrhizobium genosp. P]|uniref:restriction endonuclease subunit S n=1 Tax=Bradyrhizobium genosp. P TaxID=83641 RepID=UPI003CECF575
MSAAWPTIALGDLLLRSAQTILLDPEETYREVTVRMNGKGVIERRQVQGIEIASDRRYLAKSGHFIISRIDARNGASGIVPDELDGAVVTNDFPLFDVAKDRLDVAFLGWMSKTASFVELCKRASEGTTNCVRLSEDRFNALKIPLPPLDEQRIIVARIEELAAKVAGARTYRRNADSETQIIWQRSARERLLTLLKAAPNRTLGELVELRGGGTPSKHEPRFWQGNIPWISPKDMKRRELSDAIDHISEEATLESPAKLLQPGAVLVVVRGMILAHTFPVAVLRAPAAINQDMKALIPCADLDASYLSSVLWALNPDVLELVDRSTHDTRKLLTEKLAAFPIPVPPLSEQRRVITELDALQAKVDAVKALQAETAAQLDALLPAILDRAFKGQLA